MKTPIAVLVVVVVALGTSLSALARPQPATFTAHVTNAWFPLARGTVYVSTGVKDGKPARDVMTVTRATKVIDGAPCVVVHDRLYLRGRLAERTTDWYTQDSRGSVWYFGEATAELDRQGHITSTEGSWQAGRDGAVPGIFMPAAPQLGQSFRQEFYRGHAEDHFRIVGLFGVAAPRNALLTEEWTPLEPGVLDHKLYVRGVGQVLEQSVKGPNERLELISMRSNA
jgi:hypothetical protein